MPAAHGLPVAFREPLAWLDGQRDAMVETLAAWCRVNSGSRNPAGLTRMLALARAELEPLGDEAEIEEVPPWETVDLLGEPVAEPLGPVLRVRRAPAAPERALLAVHVDTVFGPDHPFQDVSRPSGEVLRGPGAADAKGGLVVLLWALRALERSPWAGRLGWEAVVTSDEELGSPGSARVLAGAVPGASAGLVFEPGREDGALVGARGGSGNFTAVVRGRTAHAGRNPQDGRNAIHALADLIRALRDLGERLPGVRVNTGQVAGGSAPNVVPDRAGCRFNVRVRSGAEQRRFEAELAALVSGGGRRDGIAVEIHGGFGRPPRPLDANTRRLYGLLAETGGMIDLPVRWSESAGVSDANLLAAAGLPAADGLGPWGGGIHTAGEHVRVASLVDRAKLSALFLMRWAAGDLPGAGA